MTLRRLLSGLAVALVATLVVGSASGSERFVRRSVHGQSVSLELPASWVTADGGIPQDALERIARENPKFAPYLSQLGSSSSPLKFIALDPAVRAGFATNANVVVVPVGVSPSQYRAALLAELRPLVKGPIVSRVISIHGARAVRLSYRLQIRAAGVLRTVQTLQYGFLRSGRSVVVTYSTLPPFAARYPSGFAHSASSIRFAG